MKFIFIKEITIVVVVVVVVQLVSSSDDAEDTGSSTNNDFVFDLQDLLVRNQLHLCM